MQEILKSIGTSAITAAIITPIIGYLLDSIKNRKAMQFEKRFIEKENRYRDILVFMSVVVDVNNYKHIRTTCSLKEQDEQSIRKYFKEEVECSINFAYLYAGEDVIKAMQKFNETPNKENYLEVIMEMRKDLWEKG